MSKLILPDQGWAWVPNEILKNKNLSLKAKGLWVYLNSKPQGWDFSVERIALEQQDGRDAVRSAIKELEEYGLLKRKTISRGYAHFETEYELCAEIAVEKIDGGKFDGGKVADEFPDEIIKHNIVKQNKEKHIDKKSMSEPQKAVQTRAIPQQAYELADYLHELILKNKPDRLIAKNWREAWALDIEKMNRLDGRAWDQIKGAIRWSQSDSFWWRNILSGATLRRQYDRLEADAKTKIAKNPNRIAQMVENMTTEQLIKFNEEMEKNNGQQPTH